MVAPLTVAKLPHNYTLEYRPYTGSSSLYHQAAELGSADFIQVQDIGVHV